MRERRIGSLVPHDCGMHRLWHASKGRGNENLELTDSASMVKRRRWKSVRMGAKWDWDRSTWKCSELESSRPIRVGASVAGCSVCVKREKQCEKKREKQDKKKEREKALKKEMKNKIGTSNVTEPSRWDRLDLSRWTGPGFYYFLFLFFFPLSYFLFFCNFCSFMEPIFSAWPLVWLN